MSQMSVDEAMEIAQEKIDYYAGILDGATGMGRKEIVRHVEMLKSLLAELDRLRSQQQPAEPDVVEKAVRWHKGGAQGAEWPWKTTNASETDVLFYYQNRDIPLRFAYIWRDGWRHVEWYADPAELKPPKGGATTNYPSTTLRK